MSHRNTGRATNDPVCDQLLARVSTDENLHMVFYRNLVDAAFDLFPDQTMCAVAREVTGFEMPGAGMAGFARKSVAIAKAGIYDLPQHRDEVIAPILRNWRVFEREDLGVPGERAREQLAAFMVDLDSQAQRFEEQRERSFERARARTDGPGRIGVTHTDNAR